MVLFPFDFSCLTDIISAAYHASLTKNEAPAKCEVSIANEFCGEKEGFAQVGTLMVTSERKP